MIPIKTQKEIAIMERSGKILGEVLFAVIDLVKPGVSEIDLDTYAEKLIKKKGATPGFKKVPGYKHTLCIATNDVVVHGIPTKYKLQEGDIIGLDCGVFLDGFHTDMAETVKVSSDVIARSKATKQSRKDQQLHGIASPVSELVRNDVGKQEDKIDRFLRIGKQAMWEGIAQVKPGNRIGNISYAIQQKIEKEGRYSVTRSLIGHGVGRELHEEPEVPGFLLGSINNTPLLKPGMTIAVEVIYTMGKPEVVYDGRDNWTIRSKDGSLTGLFERTVLVTKKGNKILTEK